MGAHSKCAEAWANFYQDVYHERSKLAFHGCEHLCLSVDSSTHAYRDALLGIAYSWENEQVARLHSSQVVALFGWSRLSVSCVGLASMTWLPLCGIDLQGAIQFTSLSVYDHMCDVVCGIGLHSVLFQRLCFYMLLVL